MLAAPRASADDEIAADTTPPTHHHHRHHHKRKSKKAKHSTSVQFPDAEPSASEPSWVTSESVNIESLLPSHTIQIKRIPSSEDIPNSVNIASSEQEFARAIPECSTPDKVCDVTPLDNLLAVAELELKQHMQSGNWSTDPETGTLPEPAKDIHEELTNNSEGKSEECSYNDDDEMSMNDILSRLEQSLQSPHGFGSESAFDDEEDTTCKFHHFDEDDEEEDAQKHSEEGDDDQKQPVEVKEESTDNNPSPVPSYTEVKPEITDVETVKESDETQPPPEQPTNQPEILDIHTPPPTSPKCEEPPPNHLENQVMEAESSTPTPVTEDSTAPSEDEICLDLSIKGKSQPKEDVDSGPTDLCIRKRDCVPPRPASQNSEAIQSPQPSGIPAVPASPDIVTTTSASKPRSAFLESLLATSLSKCPASAPELSKPLDLGQQSRKSASPTVTCSEEIVTPSEGEPPSKKVKTDDDITLKTLLDKDVDLLIEQHSKKLPEKQHVLPPDTPRLLSLLKASSDTEDPLVEYKQLLLEIDIPNPLMVPKDVFPDLLKHPRREILKILSGHSSKNVPLDDILVVYKDKLLAAIKSSQHTTKKTPISEAKSSNSKNCKISHQQEMNNNVNDSSHGSKKSSTSNKSPSSENNNKTSLANDIDAANEAAFNPLFWSGFPNPFEALNNYPNNHNEFIQALYAASSMPYMHNQLGDLHPSLQMMLGNKMASPLGFPPLPPLGFNNPIELSMWQEAMMQASILKNKNPYESLPQRPAAAQQQQQQKKSAHMQQQQRPKPSSMIHPAFNQTSGQSGWQNPYLGLGGFPPGNSNLSVDTQFNPFSHKNNISPGSRHSPSVMQQKKSKEVFPSYGDQEKRMHQHMVQEHQKMQQMQQQKLLRQHHQQLYQQQLMMQNNAKKGSQALGNYGFHLGQDKQAEVMSKQGNGSAPMDLSGVHSVQGRMKNAGGKSNGLVTSTRSLAEDVPEVGSTTEDGMQDGHAQLWHPLFGSQNKGYTSWPLPSLAAIGE